MEQPFTGTAFSMPEELLNINYASFTALSLPFQFTNPHMNVTEIMNTWTVQKGFPLITVSQTGNQVKVTQEHFLLNAGSNTDHRYLIKSGFALFNVVSIQHQPEQDTPLN